MCVFVMFITHIPKAEKNSCIARMQVDYAALMECCPVADLPQALTFAPQEALLCMSAAVYEVTPFFSCISAWLHTKMVPWLPDLTLHRMPPSPITYYSRSSTVCRSSLVYSLRLMVWTDDTAVNVSCD